MIGAIDMVPRKLPGTDHSHTGAWAFLRANQLKHAGLPNVMVLSEKGRGIATDWSEFDTIYLYHTMDFKPEEPFTLNVFDGPAEHTAKYFERVIWPQHSHIKFISLDYPMPDYGTRCKKKKDSASETSKMSDYWKNVDWVKVQEKCSSITDWVLDPGVEFTQPFVGFTKEHWIKQCKGVKHLHRRLLIGDSHTPSAYIPDTIILRKDGRSMRGILKKTIKKEVEDFGYDWKQVDELSCYWGNIDIRHHLCREDLPYEAARDLLKEYFKHLKSTGKQIELIAPIPIEDESRKLPGTGLFEGTPFFGARHQRQMLVNIFIEEMGNAAAKHGWKFFQWPKEWYDMDGLDFFNVMEKPRSVHLARKYYRWDLVNDVPNALLGTSPKKALFEF